MPPPPKPSPPIADDERRRDAAAEADRLGREHSNKREMKARAERRATGVPGVPGAPVVQPRRPDPRPEPRIEQRAEHRDQRADQRGDQRGDQRADGRESRVPELDPAGREGRTPAAARPAERQERAPERERPVERERPPPRPQPSARPAERAPLREEAPAQHIDGSASVIDDVAVEAEELLREGGTLWRGFSLADKITLASAMFTLLGTMLPWLRRAHEEVVLGMGSGGVVHAVIACLSVWLLIQRDKASLDERGLRPTPAKQRQRARRTALWMLLLSLLSTIAGTWFLLVYGVVRRFEVPTLEIGLGLYVSLAAGLGLSYSGFAFFWRSTKNP